jgi:hypothetical protein
MGTISSKPLFGQEYRRMIYARRLPSLFFSSNQSRNDNQKSLLVPISERRREIEDGY